MMVEPIENLHMLMVEEVTLLYQNLAELLQVLVCMHP